LYKKKIKTAYNESLIKIKPKNHFFVNTVLIEHEQFREKMRKIFERKIKSKIIRFWVKIVLELALEIVNVLRLTFHTWNSNFCNGMDIHK